MQKQLQRYIFYIITVITFIALCSNLFSLTEQLFFNVNSDIILKYILVNLGLVLILCILFVINKLSNNFTLFAKNTRRISRLKKRIIIAFSIGAALPTMMVALFSTYFFNYGIEAWFDKKISKVLDQSVRVGESYINEHIMQLKETAMSVGEDISSMYYELIHNPELFAKVINAQAELRSLDEAMVFQKNSNNILAQTSFSFSLAFMTIPAYLFEKADRGEKVYIQSDPAKIRVLIKIKGYEDTYLLIGRLVDTKILDHISKTNGAAQEYNIIKHQIISMQIKFTMVFVLLSLILLMTAIIWGKRFAEKIVKPIRELVIAAEKVKNGDFSVQVPLNDLKKDEIKVLSTAFNRMVNQIDCQQKELIVAQRALAWSDVARRVAHEIKNPLTPIQLSAERLLKKFQDQVSDPESFVKYVNNILRNSDDIRKIVSEFVEFARLPTPTFAKCEIYSLINDLIEARKLINNNIKYSFVSNTKEYILFCDVSQINRAMVNLLLNAEQAFDDEKKDKEIKVIMQVNEQSMEISIEDNGNGFSEEMLHLAKKAYVTTKLNGMGLGLSIVDKIVTDHYGQLIISNNKDVGAKVLLMINTDFLKNKLK